MKFVLGLCLVASCAGVPAVYAAGPDREPIYPELINKCLANRQAAGLLVSSGTNPVYLRGDFDRDSQADYAVAVRGKKTMRNGILICDARNRVFVLGADNPLVPPFSDLPDDNFVAQDWLVYSKAETLALKRYSFKNRSMPTLYGETIAMIFENGITFIYWDGHQYRWAGFK